MSDNHAPILDPTNIKLFFPTIFFIIIFASLLQVLIFPFLNIPDDLQWPEYSNDKKPNFFFTAYFFNVLGFFPSI